MSHVFYFMSFALYLCGSSPTLQWCLAKMFCFFIVTLKIMLRWVSQSKCEWQFWIRNFENHFSLHCIKHWCLWCILSICILSISRLLLFSPRERNTRREKFIHAYIMLLSFSLQCMQCIIKNFTSNFKVFLHFTVILRSWELKWLSYCSFSFWVKHGWAKKLCDY